MEQNYGYQQSAPPQRTPNLNHASLPRRIAAYLLDGLVLGLVTGAIILAVFFTGFWTIEQLTDPGQGFFAVYFTGFYLLIMALNLVILLAYFTYFESKKGGGATPAKKLLNLEVVDEHGQKVAAGSSFIRNLARLIWSLPCIGFIIMIIDVVLIASNNQRIGDKLAKTCVVKKKNGSIYKKTWYPPSQGQQGYQQPQKPQQQQPQQRQPPRQRPKQQQPSQPSPSPSIQQGEGRACPDCGKSMKYIETSQQWYCYSCGEYK
ncbi:MAG: RDD family protein [Candidatus Natronoplasma sp.]